MMTRNEPSALDWQVRELRTTFTLNELKRAGTPFALPVVMNSFRAA
jgi:hypothetical protein